jgi:hypothetical protein
MQRQYQTVENRDVVAERSIVEAEMCIAAQHVPLPRRNEK